MTNNPYLRSEFLQFKDSGILRTIEFMFTNEKNPKTVFEFITKRDLQFGNKTHRTATIIVVDKAFTKKKYLEKRKSIDFDFPILTEGEYIAFKKAWWIGYAEMSQNGQNRDAFQFGIFIRKLFNKASEWNIHQEFSKNIMSAFGLNTDGNFFREKYKWEPVLRSKNIKFDFKYTPKMSIRLRDGFWEYLKSSHEGIMKKMFITLQPKR